MRRTGLSASAELLVKNVFYLLVVRTGEGADLESVVGPKKRITTEKRITE